MLHCFRYIYTSVTKPANTEKCFLAFLCSGLMFLHIISLSLFFLSSLLSKESKSAMEKFSLCIFFLFFFNEQSTDKPCKCTRRNSVSVHGQPISSVNIADRLKASARVFFCLLRISFEKQEQVAHSGISVLSFRESTVLKILENHKLLSFIYFIKQINNHLTELWFKAQSQAFFFH